MLETKEHQQETIKMIVDLTRKNTQAVLDNILIPKMEMYLENGLEKRIEQIVEKKIEERFAFAIELLRSMNEKAKTNGKS